MSLPRTMLPRMGLRAQLIGLVLLAIILTICAMSALTFIGPPPRPGPVPMQVVIHTLLGDAQPGPHERHLKRYRQSFAPVAPAGMQIVPDESRRLAALMQLPVNRVRFFSDHPWMPPPRHIPQGAAPQPDEHPVFGAFLAAVERNGSWTVLRSSPLPFWSPWLQSTAILTIILCALLLVPAFLVAGRIARPLRELSDHMSRHWNHPIPSPDPGAPHEIHTLVCTLDRMQGQIARHIDERTQMLVAIAHDLRTPLTRLAFRVEKLEESERTKASHDLAEMRTMISSLLEFVSGEHRPDILAPLDLTALLSTLVDTYADTGAAVTLSCTERTIVQGDGPAMSRLFANLIDNALHYAGSAELVVEESPGFVRVIVADRGPGVAPDLLEKIFEPFFRINAARGDSTGNMGLGLATARKIAQHHGGSLMARLRPQGGLAMDVTLPRMPCD